MTHPATCVVIEVKITSPDHPEAQVVHVGDGGYDHVLNAYRTALIAAGWPMEDAVSLDWAELD